MAWKNTGSEQGIISHNLVFWGDSHSIRMLQRLRQNIPIRWSDEKVGIGDESFGAGSHVPILIYPNPKNPDRHIVINSSFTYREYDYLNNSRQVPKLPDWSIIDLSEPPGTRRPGRIADAGFFDEYRQPWKRTDSLNRGFIAGHAAPFQHTLHGSESTFDVTIGTSNVCLPPRRQE